MKIIKSQDFMVFGISTDQEINEVIGFTAGQDVLP
jgi:hypothetical protein